MLHDHPGFAEGLDILRQLLDGDDDDIFAVLDSLLGSVTEYLTSQLKGTRSISSRSHDLSSRIKILLVAMHSN